MENETVHFITNLSHKKGGLIQILPFRITLRKNVKIWRLNS